MTLVATHPMRSSSRNPRAPRAPRSPSTSTKRAGGAGGGIGTPGASPSRKTDRGTSKGPTTNNETDDAGAGTLYVRHASELGKGGGGPGRLGRRGLSAGGMGSGTGTGTGTAGDGSRLRPSSASRERVAGARDVIRDYTSWPPTWDEACRTRDEPILLPSSDALLERGIAEYTFLPAPEGVLGQGKFSTVYKVDALDGKSYALKHTPLHPHHPLIAARLLREPTLLAQLPLHPCLIGVDGWVRTEGHFYLIEQYAATHTPLPSHPLPLRPSRAAYILDQLVSVVRDCLHRGRVCHRDLKGDNVLVDVTTGDLIVLDLGLATQFSTSEAKLTTCCGSPAFHSPEIVNALNHPPGVITYFGPELDIWCIALTLLSLLLNTKFPLGTSHRSRHIMSSRVRDRLQELDAAYPPRRPSGRVVPGLSEAEHQVEEREWVRVRRALTGFLDIDGIRRMEAFGRYTVGARMGARLREFEEEDKVDEGFRQISFIKGEVKYTLPLRPVRVNDGGEVGGGGGVYGVGVNEKALPTAIEGTEGTDGTEGLEKGNQGEHEQGHRIVLVNPTHESDRRVLSYLKYLLRTHGILYHCITSIPHTIFQLVVPLPIAPPDSRSRTDQGESGSGVNVTNDTPKSWLPSIFRPKAPRSASMPARHPAPSPLKAGAGTGGEKNNDKHLSLRCFARIEFKSNKPIIRQRERERKRRPSASSSATGTTQASGTATATSTAPRSYSYTGRSLSAHASLGMTRRHVNGTTVSVSSLSPTSASGDQNLHVHGVGGTATGMGLTPIAHSPRTQDGTPRYGIESDGGSRMGSGSSSGSGSGNGNVNGVGHVNGHGEGEGSLAVATLQNALLRITTSPTPSSSSVSHNHNSHITSPPETPTPRTAPTSPYSTQSALPSGLRPDFGFTTATATATATANANPRPQMKRAVSQPRPAFVKRVSTLSHNRHNQSTAIDPSTRSVRGGSDDDSDNRGISTGTDSPPTPTGSLPASRAVSRTSSRAPSRVASRAASRAPSVSASTTSAGATASATATRSPPTRYSTLSLGSTMTLSNGIVDVEPDFEPEPEPEPSIVIFHLSDSRAISPIRRAFDQVHQSKQGNTPRGHARIFTPPTPGVDIPWTLSPDTEAGDNAREGQGQAAELDVEAERGRPRSKEDKYVLVSSTTPTPPNGVSAHASARTKVSGEGEGGGEDHGVVDYARQTNYGEEIARVQPVADVFPPISQRVKGDVGTRTNVKVSPSPSRSITARGRGREGRDGREGREGKERADGREMSRGRRFIDGLFGFAVGYGGGGGDQGHGQGAGRRGSGDGRSASVPPRTAEQV